MAAKPVLLVAEDDADIRDIIRTRLQTAGYEIEVARTGMAALQRIAVRRPDAMLLDINMPELDGFGVLQRLRDGKGPAIRTLVLTARHGSDDVRRAVELGAKDYLTKPFSEGQLLARVARLLRV